MCSSLYLSPGRFSKNKLGILRTDLAFKSLSSTARLWQRVNLYHSALPEKLVHINGAYLQESKSAADVIANGSQEIGNIKRN